MRAYASSSLPPWAVGLQGAADTLGGSAEFALQKRGQDADIRQQDEALNSRRQEESRRQQAFQLDLQEAQARQAQRQAGQQAHYTQAQQELEQDRERIFAQMMGGPATVDQDREMRQLDSLARELKPENAEILIDQHRTQKGIDASMQALQGLSQEVMRPVTEGTVQDPQVQQQLGMIQQGLSQLAPLVQSGQIKPEHIPKLFDQAIDYQQSLLKEYAKRQADLQQRQMTMASLDQHMAGIQPGDPRGRKLAEAKQLVGMGLMDERQVGTMLIADQYGVDEEKMKAYADFAAINDQANRGVQGFVDQASRTFGAQPGPGPSFPQGGDMQAFSDAVRKVKNITPDQVRVIARRYGVTDVPPEVEEALFGGG